jgi:chitin deacetylase
MILEHELSNQSVQAFIDTFPNAKAAGWTMLPISQLTKDGSAYRNAENNDGAVSSASLLVGNAMAAATSSGPLINSASSSLTTSVTATSTGTSASSTAKTGTRLATNNSSTSSATGGSATAATRAQANGATETGLTQSVTLLTALVMLFTLGAAL